MDNGIDAMSGAMHKVIGVACVGYHSTGDIIDLAALNSLTCLQLFANEGNGGVTRSRHNVEDSKVAMRNLFAGTGKSHPGIVGVDGFRFWHVRPEVEEDQVATLDGAVLLASRSIMGIADIGVDGYMYIGLDQSQLFDQCQETLLHAVFIHCCARA